MNIHIKTVREMESGYHTTRRVVNKDWGYHRSFVERATLQLTHTQQRASVCIWQQSVENVRISSSAHGMKRVMNVAVLGCANGRYDWFRLLIFTFKYIGGILYILIWQNNLLARRTLLAGIRKYSFARNACSYRGNIVTKYVVQRDRKGDTYIWRVFQCCVY